MSECMFPSSHHSDDTVELWHGRSAPAIGCGFHVFNFGPELAAAHNKMLAGE